MGHIGDKEVKSRLQEILNVSGAARVMPFLLTPPADGQRSRQAGGEKVQNIFIYKAKLFML